MSVTFHLYKVLDNVDYLGDNPEKIRGGTFSDGKEHSILDKANIKQMFKGKRGLSRLLSRLDTFKLKTYDTKSGWTHTYLVLDEEVYRQGFILKNRFYRKEITYVVCTTKKQLEDLFNQYMKRSGKEIAEVFLSHWEPGMLFTCCW